MNRRNFFSKLFGNKEGESFFFGLQMVINPYGTEGLRKKLHDVINESADDETPEDKRLFYKRVTSLLSESQHFTEYGYWDYTTDADKADNEFETWVSEIEASMATESEEIGEKVNELYRYSSNKYYVVVSLFFLMENVEAHDQFWGLVEGIAEQDYFTQKTYGKLLEAINYLDFEYAYGDAAFIMPGNEEDGISLEDITGEGWDYLKMLS